MLSPVFPGKHWAVLRLDLVRNNRVPSIAFDHLISGVWNTTQWGRFNPPTMVAEPCSLACHFGRDCVQVPKSGIQGR